MDEEQYALRVIHFGFQLPLEYTWTADLCPKPFETSLFVTKTDVPLCILSAPGAQNGPQRIVSDGPKSDIGCTLPS